MSDRQKKLLDSLYLQTFAEKLEWERGGTDDSYELLFPNSTVTLKKVISNNTSYVQLYIHDKDGVLVETINPRNLAGMPLDQIALTPLSGAPSSYEFLANKLFTMAKRNALGSDKIIDDIISTINAK